MNTHFYKKLLTLLLTSLTLAPTATPAQRRGAGAGDGEACDGVYGGRSADGLARGDYFVEVEADAAVAAGFVGSDK